MCPHNSVPEPFYFRIIFYYQPNLINSLAKCDMGIQRGNTHGKFNLFVKYNFFYLNVLQIIVQLLESQYSSWFHSSLCPRVMWLCQSHVACRNLPYQDPTDWVIRGNKKLREYCLIYHQTLRHKNKGNIWHTVWRVYL